MAIKSIESAVVSKPDLAGMLGISLRTFERRVSDGTLIPTERPPKGTRGQFFDFCANTRRYIAYIEARNDQLAKNSAHKNEMLRHDVEIKRAKAIMLEMEATELQRIMHRAEDVDAMTADLIETIRRALLSLPERLTAAILSLQIPRVPSEVAAAMRSEVYSVMAELANYRYDGRCVNKKVKQIKEGSGIDRDTAAKTIK